MRANSKAHLAVAFMSAFLAVGVPYWQIPYAQVSLPGTLVGWSLVIVAAVAAVMRLGCRASFVRALFGAGLAVPAAVMARVIVEASQDPTSHNLWPFEVVIAGLLGMGVALLGGVLPRFSRTGAADGMGSVGRWR